MDNSIAKFWTRFPELTGNFKCVHCGVLKQRSFKGVQFTRR